MCVHGQLHMTPLFNYLGYFLFDICLKSALVNLPFCFEKRYKLLNVKMESNGTVAWNNELLY